MPGSVKPGYLHHLRVGGGLREPGLVSGAVLTLTALAFFRVALLPEFGEELAMTTFQLGLVTTIFAIGRLVADLPGGHFADRIRAPNLIAVSAAGVAAGSLILGVSVVALTIYLGSFMLGVSSATTNATGMTFMSVEINPKRIDLIRDILPSCRHIALLSNARHAGEEKEIAACQQAVAGAGVNLSTYRLQSAAEASAALERALDAGAESVIALPSASMLQQTPTLAAACLRRRVPLIGGWAEMARGGALLTYGANLREAYRRVTSYVVRILDGAAADWFLAKVKETLENWA